MASDDSSETTLERLRRLIGDEATLNLVDRVGGIKVAVPMVARDSSSLLQVMDMLSLKALVAEYKGCVVDIPVAREFRIKAMRKSGYSYSQIAVRLCMKESTVYRYTKEISRKERRAALLRSLADGSELAKPRKLP